MYNGILKLFYESLSYIYIQIIFWCSKGGSDFTCLPNNATFCLHSGVLERKIALVKKLNGPGVISFMWFIIFYSKFCSIPEDAMNNKNVQRFNILLPSRNTFPDKMAILSGIIIIKRDITFSFPFPGNYVWCSFTRHYSRTKLIPKILFLGIQCLSIMTG